MKNIGTPWWKFWNPGSGLVGGIIAGCVVVAIVWMAGELGKLL